MANADKNKALTDCHKCSSSFLSIVKSVLEKVRAGSCLKLFLIDCSDNANPAAHSLNIVPTKFDNHTVNSFQSTLAQVAKV